MSDSWDPWTVARQASFVCGISQARILVWVAILLHYIIKIQLKIKKKKKIKRRMPLRNNGDPKRVILTQNGEVGGKGLNKERTFTVDFKE